MAPKPEQVPPGAGREPASAPFSGPALRNQAEAALRASTLALMQRPDEPWPDDIERTVHELRVHQIELEMQNEELQRRQLELNAANIRYQDLYDLAPVGYCTVSESDQILEINLTASTQLGLARSALVKQQFSRFVYSKDMDTYYLMRRALHKSGQAQTIELRMLPQVGTPFWAQIVTNLSQSTEGAKTLRLVLTDITARKALEAEREHYRADLEEQVRCRTRQYLDLYDQAPCGYHSLSTDGVITRVNKTELALLGFAPEEFVGQSIAAFMTPESAAVFQGALPRLLETGSSRNMELDFHCRDGSLRPFVMDSDVVTGPSGEPQAIQGTLVDISERKHNAQRLELALMGADLGLWDQQIASGALHLSARVCAMLGYPEGGIGPHLSHFDALVHPHDEPARRAAFDAIKRGDVPYYRMEYRIRHKDGHWVWVRSQGRIVERDENLAPVRAAGTLQDITMEQQLKLEGANLLQRIESLIQAFGKAQDVLPPPEPETPPIHLGARELQVIQLIASGCTSAEIAGHLGISTSTAVTHRRNLMRKLDLHSAAELTRYAVLHKLIAA